MDALNRTVPGTVDTIIPASTSTFSLLPAQNAAGNFKADEIVITVRGEAFARDLQHVEAKFRLHVCQRAVFEAGGQPEAGERPTGFLDGDDAGHVEPAQ